MIGPREFFLLRPSCRYMLNMPYISDTLGHQSPVILVLQVEYELSICCHAID